MKKYLAGLFILAFSVACSKTHTCTCVTSDSSGTNADETETYTIEGKKDDADYDCRQNEKQVGSFTVDCTLE